MAYTIKIEYRGPQVAPDSIVSPICRIFEPNGSYIDSPAYVNGYAEGGKQKYGKSVYATNVDGWGKIEAMEPYASTSIPFPVPLAQFKVAMIGDEIKEGKTVVGHKFEFSVEDYKEAIYYMQLGVALKSQGFTVTVTGGGAAAGVAAEASETK